MMHVAKFDIKIKHGAEQMDIRPLTELLHSHYDIIKHIRFWSVNQYDIHLCVQQWNLRVRCMEFRGEHN